MANGLLEKYKYIKERNIPKIILIREKKLGNWRGSKFAVQPDIRIFFFKCLHNIFVI